MKKIISDTINIYKPNVISTEIIEGILQNNFKDVIRWAIVEIDDNSIKISVTYEI